MKKYKVIYDNVVYIINPYNMKYKGELNSLLSNINKDDEGKAIEILNTLGIVKDKGHYRKDGRVIRFTNSDKEINIHYGTAEYHKKVMRILHETNIRDIFDSFEELDLTDEELMILYPNNEIKTEIKSFYNEFLEDETINFDESMSNRNELSKYINEKWPLSKIKSAKLDYFNRNLDNEDFVKFISYDSEINKFSPGLGQIDPEAFFGFKFNDKTNQLTLKRNIELDEISCSDYNSEIVELITNYEKYQYMSEIEVNSRFKYIDQITISVILKRYIYGIKPNAINTFMNKSKIKEFNKKLGIKPNNISFLEINYILIKWLESIGVKSEHIYLFVLWLSKEKKFMGTNEKEVKNTLDNEVDYSEIFMNDNDIEFFVNEVKNHKNVIVKGQPGVGKTRNVKNILKLNKFNVDYSIQFSSNYEYSDFVIGYKPVAGSVGFEVKKGIFMQCCEKAIENPEVNYAFIIDEINRGNVSSIFGELFTLIEKDYRNADSSKMIPNYENRFYIPENVYIIGTMNTIDRSLFSFDFAMQRRFKFINFKPNFNDKLVNFIDNNHESDLYVIDDVKLACKKMINLNEKLSEIMKNDAYMFGQSYLLRCVNQCDFKTEFNNMVNTDILNILNILNQFKLQNDDLEDEIEDLISETRI